MLRDEGYEVDAAADGLEALAALGDKIYDVVITDLRMPGADGLAVLRRVREIAPQTLVLLITAYASVETAVEALRRGAHDYILKPLILEDVLGKISRLFEHRQLAWESQMLRQQLEARYDFEQMIIGQSQAMRDILQLIRKVAPTNSNVLITGESGVGKEVVARAIHHYSRLHDKLFLPVNCGAIPAELLESQLFGHAKGRSRGRSTAQEGLFQRARGGTIFLDEIGDLPLNLQVKLLRAIQEKEILPVGTTHADQGRRAHHRGDQPRSTQASRGGAVPRGSLLPPERGEHRDPAAARTARRHPAPRRIPDSAPQRAT